MKKIFSLLIISIITFSYGISQDILMTIGDKKVSKEEFVRIYSKNNSDKNENSVSIEEYLQLFINFKLKVLEAEKTGYDTTKSFINEFNKYFSQLAEPFFNDQNLEEELIKEAYERSHKEVRISYIMIKIPSQDPQDTLKAYNKAIGVYKSLQNGENFEKLAVENSETASVKTDKGDAWFSPIFVMPYALETFAFEGKVGDFSSPLISGNSYFILKITDNRPAPGKVKASHIYIRLPQNPTVEDSLKAMKLIDSIQLAFKEGRTFEDIAKQFSQDNFSAPKGGDLGWFGTGKMLKSFEEVVFNMKNIGDQAGPIRTTVGYHFIKLTDKDPIGTYEEEYQNLKKEIKNQQRFSLIKDNILINLKKEYKYKKESELTEFYQKVDETIFKKEWKADAFKNDKRVLFSFADKKITFEDFANYLASNQKQQRPSSINTYINEKYKEYVNTTIKNYEYTQLPNKNQQFKDLVQEYHDGLLLFDITNDKVWDKAIKDTLGLKNYFIQNRNKYIQKVKLEIYSYSDEKAATKTVKLLNKRKKKNLTSSDIEKNINKTAELIKYEQTTLFKAGENEVADYIIDLMKNNQIKNNQNSIIVDKFKKIVYICNYLSSVKGLVTADYQNTLEDEWIKSLRKKYTVKIDEKIWTDIKEEMSKK